VWFVAGPSCEGCSDDRRGGARRLAIAVGLVGVVLPVVPGALFVWASIVAWAIDVGTPAGWAVVAAATAVIAGGQVVKYTIPGKQLKSTRRTSPITRHRRACRHRRVLRRARGGSVHRVRCRHLCVRAPASRRTNGLAIDNGCPARRGCLDASRARIGAAGHGGVDHRGPRHLTLERAALRQIDAAVARCTIRPGRHRWRPVPENPSARQR
jgi:hypothetical protein